MNSGPNYPGDDVGWEGKGILGKDRGALNGPEAGWENCRELKLTNLHGNNRILLLLKKKMV